MFTSCVLVAKSCKAVSEPIMRPKIESTKNWQGINFCCTCAISSKIISQPMDHREQSPEILLVTY